MNPQTDPIEGLEDFYAECRTAMPCEKAPAATRSLPAWTAVAACGFGIAVALSIALQGSRPGRTDESAAARWIQEGQMAQQEHETQRTEVPRWRG